MYAAKSGWTFGIQASGPNILDPYHPMISSFKYMALIKSYFETASIFVKLVRIHVLYICTNHNIVM